MSSVSGAGGSIGSPLPKWQLALAVGAPVAALGLGYMYYRNSSTKGSQKSSKQKEPSLNGTDKQISIDGDLPAELSKTEVRKGSFCKLFSVSNKHVETCLFFSIVNLSLYLDLNIPFLL